MRHPITIKGYDRIKPLTDQKGYFAENNELYEATIPHRDAILTIKILNDRCANVKPNIDINEWLIRNSLTTDFKWSLTIELTEIEKQIMFGRFTPVLVISFKHRKDLMLFSLQFL